MKLSGATLRNPTPKSAIQKPADGGGLYLRNAPTGGTLWRMAY